MSWITVYPILHFTGISSNFPRYVYRSIARPTCHALEEQALIGPLLTNPDLHVQYLEYAQQFVDTVMANSSLLEEMQSHAEIIDPFVRKDKWAAFGAFFDKELSPDVPIDWEEEASRMPLLPFMKARTEDLRLQFDAINSGALPRGPHVGVEGENEPLEPCADWRAKEANRTMCELGCKYDGCHMPGFTVPSYCDENTGKCYHADFDDQCMGVWDREKTPGMEDTEDGREVFCRYAKGIHTKMIECPAPGQGTGAGALESSGATNAMRSVAVKGLLLVLGSVAAALVM